MALPWYSTELIPLKNPDSNPPKHFERKKLWSMDPVRNIIVKSNNLFNLPEKKLRNLADLEKDAECENPYHSGLVNKAFFPMRITLISVGRWPFPMRLKAITSPSRKNRSSGLPHKKYRLTRVKNYDSGLMSPLWIYFGLTTLFITFVLVVSTLGFLDFFLKWDILPGCDWDTLDDNIFHDNLVMFLLIWGCLVHGTVSSFSFLLNRKKVVRILNYWNVVVDELQIDEVKSHRRFLIASNLTYILFLVLIYCAYSEWRIPLVREGAALFGTLALRPFLHGRKLTKTDIGRLRIYGIATMIYAVYASRAFLFIFCFKCRLLRSLFRVWNSRLVRFLQRPDDNQNEDKEAREIMEKDESQRLLDEMAVLLKLVKKTDKMFATVLQAYYAVQLLNMCFELYMLAKSGSEEFTRSNEDGNGNAKSTRELDIISAILTLIQNVYFFFTVSLDGAYVGEEAAKGLDILRCNSISPHSSIYRKYLVYNLGNIYNQKIAVTGGKFFIIDRPFIITVLGAVLTYFVIILQVGPSLQKQSS